MYRPEQAPINDKAQPPWGFAFIAGKIAAALRQLAHPRLLAAAKP